MNFLTNKKSYRRAVPLFAIIIAATVIFGLSSCLLNTQGSNINKDMIENTVKEALITSLSAGSYQAEGAAAKSGKVSDLSDEEKTNIKKEYESDLKRVFSEDSVYYKNLKQTNENIINKREGLVSNVIENGFFNFKVESLDIKENSATIEVSVIGWQKYITQREDNLHFTVAFPVNSDRIVFELVKQDEDWKVITYTIKNKLIDGDSDSERTFKTYEEALDYANKTMPNNVF